MSVGGLPPGTAGGSGRIAARIGSTQPRSWTVLSAVSRSPAKSLRTRMVTGVAAAISTGRSFGGW